MFIRLTDNGQQRRETGFNDMIKTAEAYHIPVLLEASIDGLNLRKGGVYVDATFGGGGIRVRFLPDWIPPAGSSVSIRMPMLHRTRWKTSVLRS